MEDNEAYSVDQFSPKSSLFSLGIVSTNIQSESLTAKVKNISMSEEEFVHPKCPTSSRNIDVEKCEPSISPAIAFELEHSSDAEEVQESANIDMVEPLPLGCEENPKAIQSLPASLSSSLPPTLPAMLQSITSATLVTISSTQLSYNIPREIANLKSLIVADFSHNNFTGRILDSNQLLCGLISNPSPQSLTKSIATRDPTYIPPFHASWLRQVVDQAGIQLTASVMIDITIKANDIESNLESLTVDEALQSKKLFIIDYHGPINAQAHHALRSANGLLGFTVFPTKHALEMSEIICKSWNFVEQGLSADLPKRGMAEVDKSSPGKEELSSLLEDPLLSFLKN